MSFCSEAVARSSFTFLASSVADLSICPYVHFSALVCLSFRKGLFKIVIVSVCISEIVFDGLSQENLSWWAQNTSSLKCQGKESVQRIFALYFSTFFSSARDATAPVLFEDHAM